MTTLQKAGFTVAILAAIGLGFYATRQNSVSKAEVEMLHTQQAALAEELASVRAAKGTQDGKANEHRPPTMSSARLRELLKLRSEVGKLRRRTQELEQTLAGAPTTSPAAGRPPTATPPNQPSPRPFQLQLVLDQPGDDTETLTNATGKGEAETLHVQKTPLLDYSAIQSATVSKNADTGSPEIAVEMSEDGKELFAAVTSENLNKRLAIVLSGQVFAAPVIRTPITGGKAMITGNFSEEEAKELADRINQAIAGQ